MLHTLYFLAAPPVINLVANSQGAACPPPLNFESSVANFIFVDEAARAESLKAIRILYGPDAAFKSVHQENLVSYALWSDVDLLGILPTGVGKSVAFFAFAKRFPLRHSVVLVPTLSLRDDLKRRADQLQISCCSNFMDYQHEALLVAVTDELGRGDFIVLLASLCSDRRTFGKIFVDEAHTFASDISYRSSMRMLAVLTCFGVPIVALTATCCPRIKDYLLCNLFGPSRLPVIIRQDSNRANLRYQSVHVETFAEAHAAVLARISRLGNEERAIVFCLSRSCAEDLGRRLNSATHHSELSDTDRSHNTRLWLDGTKKVMCATSGFGVGVDVKNVRSIIFWGMPYDIESFCQQAGRAGRDGLPSDVILLRGKCFQGLRTAMIQPHQTPIADPVISNFYESRSCRRQFLSRYFGDQEMSCAQSGSIPCDNCQSQRPEASSLSLGTRHLDTSHGMVRLQAVDVFERKLMHWAHYFKKTDSGQKCCICFVLDRAEKYHPAEHCSHFVGKCFDCPVPKYPRQPHSHQNRYPPAQAPMCYACYFPPQVHFLEQNVEDQQDRITGLNSANCELGNTIKRFTAFFASKNPQIVGLVSQKNQITAYPEILHRFVEKCEEASL